MSTAEATAVTEAEATSTMPRKGFVYALAFAAVRNGDRKVIGSEFRTVTTKGEDIKWPNVEAPAPITEAAAKQAAEDCNTTIYTLNPDGSVKEHKLNGVVAAVNIALQQRRDEGGRGKVRGRHIKGEDQFRSLMLSTYGFQFDKVEVSVSREDLARILSDEPSIPETDEDGVEILDDDGEPILRVATAQEKLAAMEAMIQAAGAVVK